MQVAMGWLPEFVAHGNDHDTRDGTCIRCFVRVSDIARAYVQAFDHIGRSAAGRQPAVGSFKVLSLGSGVGSTMLEIVHSFERVAGRKLDCRIGPRRPGDVEAIYANNARAAAKPEWQLRFDTDDMMRTAWLSEQKPANSTSVSSLTSASPFTTS